MLLFSFQIGDMSKGALPFLIGEKFIKATPVELNDTGVDTCTGSSSSKSCDDVVKVKYEYVVDGQKYTGSSYCEDDYNDDDIKIRYSSLNPEYSYATGCSITVLSTINWVFSVFLFVGLLLVFNGIKQAMKQIYLLQKGSIAEGQIVSIRLNGNRSGEKRGYAVIFKFKDTEGNEYEAKHDTFNPDAVRKKRSYVVLYDERNPQNAVLFDLLHFKKSQ